MITNSSSKSRDVINRLSGYSLIFYCATICFANGTILFYSATVIFFIIQSCNMILRKEFIMGTGVVLYICFLLYHLILIFSGVAYNIDFSLNRLFIMALNFVICILISNYLRYTDNRNKFIKQYIGVVFIFALYTIIFSREDLFSGRLGWEMPYFLGLKGEYNPNTIGLSCSFASIFCLYLFVEKKNRKTIYLMIFFSFVILLTGSRKSLIMISVMYILYPVIYYKKNRFSLVIISSAILVSIYITIIIVPIFYNIIGYRVQDVINGFLNDNTFQESSAISRQNIIVVANQLFVQKPIFGYGIDSFRLISNLYGSYAHNNYYEMLIGGGIIGTILYYLLYIYLIISLYKLNKKDVSMSCLMYLFVVVLAIVDYTLVSYLDREVMMMLFVGYSIILDNRNLDTKKEVRLNAYENSRSF